MEKIHERFIRYAKINTRSNPSSDTIPSSPNQVEFAKYLLKDLLELGFDAKLDEDNYFVSACLKKNCDLNIDPIVFIAHYDTADYNSENINPRIIYNYDAKDISLNENMIMKVSDFPNLLKYQGKSLIVTDGTTLLGSDDKSGICEIIEAFLYLKNHPEIKHGDITMAFGPDEEIGRGADRFKVKEIGAKYAYTLDGSALGEIEYESFNAASAKIKIKGISVHPGSAKDKMINSIKLAYEIDSLLPKNDVPEKTEGYEGFFLNLNIKGSIDYCESDYIIRDHDQEKFLKRKELLNEIVNKINARYNYDPISIEIKDEYYNMGDIIKNDFKVVEIALSAMKKLDIKPKIAPIRGGTDGSKLSYMGLPCPNLFTGGENFHGPYEFVCIEDMEMAVKLIIEIIKEYAK